MTLLIVVGGMFVVYGEADRELVRLGILIIGAQLALSRGRSERVRPS